MSHLRFALLASFALFSAACHDKDAVSNAASASKVTIVALKLVATPEGASASGPANFGFKVLELHLDGSLVRDGQPFGAIKDDQVEGVDGKPFFAIGTDGTLASHHPDHDEYAKLKGPDTVVGRGGVSIRVADDGTITFARADGTVQPLPGKFETMPANGKTAAVLIVASTRPGLALWGKEKP
jgi:hypothetical protein